MIDQRPPGNCWAILPEFHLDPDRAPVFHGGNNLGIDSMHLVWEPPGPA